jgi:hypothetical protein
VFIIGNTPAAGLFRRYWVYRGRVILVAATKRRPGGYRQRPARPPWQAWRPASRRDWVLTGSALAAVAGLAAVMAWWLVTPARYVPPARQRQYLSFAACLLTGPAGLADPASAPVWAGMQSASLATRAKVEYLAVTGPATEANAMIFLNTLVMRQCNVVLAAGSPEVAAVAAKVAALPHVRFVTVGGAAGPGNLTVLAPGRAQVVSSAVDGAVRQAVAAASSPA